METIFVNITSHELKQEQVDEAREKFGATNIIELPLDLKDMIRNISPELDDNYIVGVAVNIYSWVLDKIGKAQAYCLVQGEYAMTYALVRMLHKNSNIFPVVATTKRYSEEFTDQYGKVHKRSIFSHVRFRSYPSDGIIEASLDNSGWLNG